MPHFVFRWKFTSQAIGHIIKNPADRSRLIRVMIEDFQGKLISYYWTFEEYDGFFIVEFPDFITAMAYAKAAEATEGFSKYEVKLALTAEEARTVQQTAHDTKTAYFLYRASLHPQDTAHGSGEPHRLI